MAALFQLRESPTPEQRQRWVAHEINNLLQYVTAQLEMIEDPFPGADPRRQARDALRAVERTAALVRELQRDDGELPLDAAGVDLAGALDFATEIARPRLRRGRATLVCEYGKDLPRARGSAVGLSHVFINLLVNAADAVADGPQRSNVVKLKAGRIGDAVRVEVRDTGPGVPKEIGDRVFEPGFTTRARGKGVGLWLCRDVVESAGGSIAYATDAFGTTFRVVLPVADGQ